MELAPPIATGDVPALAGLPGALALGTTDEAAGFLGERWVFTQTVVDVFYLVAGMQSGKLFPVLAPQPPPLGI